MFQDPAADLSVTDPDYLAEILPHLILVPETEGLISMYPDWKHRVEAMNEYNHLRGEAYQAGPSPRALLDDIWYGNDNAALTVFATSITPWSARAL